MKLKEIPRTAAFAWSPDAQHPTIVTGSAAGTIDSDFSAASALELWKLDLLDHSIASFSAEPTAHVETNARFYDLAFNESGDVVVGALESGAVEAWNAKTLSSRARNTEAHTGAAKAVGFNRHDKPTFATAGAHGQVLVWSLENQLKEPTQQLNKSTSQQQDDINCLQWNFGAAKVLASAGSRGFTSIWDTRRQREVLHLHHTSASGVRAPVSSVQWHPTISTKLATASMDDAEPVVLIWDMKNVNSPEQVLRGHSKGVLSIDWCHQDPQLLLSGGKDNATMLWNPEKGALLGSYPLSVEWVFKTQFHPKLPDLFASASFDGKVSVQTLQDTAPLKGSKQEKATTTSGGDFWECDTVMDTVHPSFHLTQPPKWLQRPCSAVCGFGGKLAIARNGKVEVRRVRDSALDESRKEPLKKAMISNDFTGLVGASDSGDWHATFKQFVAGSDIKLPEELMTDEGNDDDDDDFTFAPQFSPRGAFELLQSSHRDVVKAVLAGDLDSAVSKLIARDEPSDALLVASFGGPDLVARAQNAYLSSKADHSAHLRAVWAVSTGHWDDIVENSELEAWPTVLQSLLQADTDLGKSAGTIATRLVSDGQPDNALTAVLAGKNAAAAAGLWLDELPEIERELAKKSENTAFMVQVTALQQVVEKIAATCSRLGLPNVSDPGADRLYSAFRDYADLAAQQGDLELAKLFLDKLPEEYSLDKQRVSVASAPVKAATAAPAGGVRTRPANSGVSSVPGAPSVATGGSNYVQAAHAPSAVPGAAPTSGNVPSVRSAARVPSASPYSNPYSPSGVSPAMASIYSPPGSGVPSAPTSMAASTPPPPPVVGAASVPPPLPSSGSHKGWNDVPELPTGPRRAPAAPTRVAPPRAPSQPGAPPISAGSSPRGSVTGPSGVRPPGAGVSPGVPHPVAAVPIAAPRAPPPNPYAPKHAPARSTASPSANNPYAPPPGATSPVTAQPPSRPYSRTAAPVRAARAYPAAPPTASAPPAAHVPPPANGPVPAAAPAPATAPLAASATTSSTTEEQQFVKQTLQSECTRIRDVVEGQYAKAFHDTLKRLDMLYAKLPELSEPLIQLLNETASLVASGDIDAAMTLAGTIITDFPEEKGQWSVGLARLLKMSKAVPV